VQRKADTSLTAWHEAVVGVLALRVQRFREDRVAGVDHPAPAGRIARDLAEHAVFVRSEIRRIEDESSRKATIDLKLQSMRTAASGISISREEIAETG